MRWFPVTALAVLAAAAAAPQAHAAQRHVTPTAVATSGSCAEELPCTLDAAVAGASADDEIIVGTGDYHLSAPLTVNVRLTITGAPGEHPSILGPFSSPTVSMEQGGTLRHLAISSSGIAGTAVRMRGGLLDDTGAVATGLGGIGLDATSENGGLLVRDSAFRAWSFNAAGAAVTVAGAGEAKLLNVTAYADTGPTGVVCEPDPGGSVKLVNTLVRGAVADIDAPKNGCSARFSNFRPDHSSGISALGNNQSAEPVLLNVAAGLFLPLAGSPTIDAGTRDADLGVRDLWGIDRLLGGAPDIGAYEFTPPPEPVKEPGKPDHVPPPAVGKLPEPATNAPRAADPEPVPRPAAPKLGKSVVLDAAEGEVLVKTPGGRFVKLSDAANLPVGTVIDTRNGAVTLQASLGGGRAQTGTFSGGQFTIRQDPKAKGMTDLHLTGGSRAGCRTGRKARAASAGQHAKKKNRNVVRRLWGKDKSGRFRTHGSKSVATVRGTRWLTEDRCEGTFTKVTEGAVDVRSKRSGKVTRVRAGRDVLVK